MRPSEHASTVLDNESTVAQDDNWLLGYLDVFVLITTFFLMLLALDQTEFGDSEETEFGTISEQTNSVHDSLQQTIQPQTIQDEYFIAAAPIAPFEQQAGNAPLLRTQLQQSIVTHGMESHVRVVEDESKTRLEIQSRVLFDSGDAFLTRSGESVLERLSPILKEVPGNILIEGHTDDQPIATAKYPSNWNLAAARASEVLSFFVSEGFDARRFRAISYGDTQPLVANDNPLNRSKNRRVTLVIEQAL